MKLIKNSFIKNILTLISGSGLSQIIMYAFIPVLTRLFYEEMFGVFMLFSSTVLLLKPLISYQLELAIVVPETTKKAINVFASLLGILLINSLVLFILIFLFKKPIVTFFNLQSLSYFLYFLPFAVFLYGASFALEYWNNRNENFKTIAKAQLIKSSTMSIGQVTTGLSIKSLGLIPGYLAGMLFQVISLLKNSYSSLRQEIHHVSFSEMKQVLKQYKDIPIYSTIINFSNTLSNELPILLITKFFGIKATGIYGLASKVSKAPTGIVQNSVSQVFFSKATQIVNDRGDLKTFVLNTIKGLVISGSLLFCGLGIISFFFEFIFGNEWKDVGLYTRILIPWLFFMFLCSPITPLITILNRQKALLVFDILLLIFRFLALYVGFKLYNDLVISLVLFSVVGAIFNIFMIFYLINISNKKQIGYQ